MHLKLKSTEPAVTVLLHGKFLPYTKVWYTLKNKVDLVPLSLKFWLGHFPDLKSTWADLVDFPKSNSTRADLVNFPSQLEKYFSSGSGGSLCCPARPWTWYWRVLSGAGHCRRRGRPTSFRFLSSTFPAQSICRLIFLVRTGMKRSLFSGRGSFSSSELCCHSDPRCNLETHTQS